MASIKSQDNSIYLGSSFYSSVLYGSLNKMTSTDISSSVVIKRIVAFFKVSLPNRLVVQLGLNQINSLTALYPSQNIWFHVETTQGIISILHLPWSPSVTFSWEPSSLHFVRLQPYFLKSAKKCSSPFRTPIHSHLASSPMLEASVRKDVGAVLFCFLKI